MNVYTKNPEMYKYLKDNGFEPKLIYRADGYTHWGVVVPDDNMVLRTPEYMNMALKERLEVPRIIRKRMTPPLYTLKIDGAFGDLMLPNSARCVPLTRERKMLLGVISNSGVSGRAAIVELKNIEKVKKVLINAKNDGIKETVYLIPVNFTEYYSINSVLHALMVNEGGLVGTGKNAKRIEGKSKNV